MNREAGLDGYLEGNRAYAKQILQELVEIESTTGQEGAVQEYVQEMLKKIGCSLVQKVYADNDSVRLDPDYIESGYSFAQRPNVLGTFYGSRPDSHKSLLFLCHIDTVSPGPTSHWTKHHLGEEKGSLFYGRGSWDMKGGLVAAALALKAVIDLNVPLQGNVMIASTIEEESGGAGGTLALLLGGLRADGVVCPEPEQKIAIASAGICYFRIKVKGKSAHAGRAHQGINAIEKLNKIFERLRQLDEKRGREIRFSLFEKLSARACHLNVGVYRAGDWPSTVPGEAFLEGRASFVPGETLADIREMIRECTRFEDDEWLKKHPPEIEWFGWQANPWLQDAGHPLVTTFQSCAEQVLGREVEIYGKTAGLDARFCGRFGLPALSFGPTGGNMHGADEYVDFPSIMECAKIYARLIYQWCC